MYLPLTCYESLRFGFKDLGLRTGGRARRAFFCVREGIRVCGKSCTCQKLKMHRTTVNGGITFTSCKIASESGKTASKGCNSG